MMSLDESPDLTRSISDVEESTAKLKLSPSPKPKKNKSSVSPSFLPPCQVCNAASSGYHYGASTCEACKAFFRRSIGHEDAIRPCSSNGKCADSPNGKIVCADCRHKKCLSLGMAKEGCKRGRYTYEKKNELTRQVRRLQAEQNASRIFEMEKCAETLVMITSQFEKCFPPLYTLIMDKEKIDTRIQKAVEDHYGGQPICRVLYSPGHTPNTELQNWYETINSHLEQISCYPEESEVAHALSDNMVFDLWMFQAEKDFRGLTSFVKCVPGFADLVLEDRILLLKTGQADAFNIFKHKAMYLDIEVLVRYEHETGDLFLFPLHMMRKFAGDEFADSMFSVNSRVQKLNLTLEDIAVLLAFVIVAPDREGLQRTDQVEILQDKLLVVLQYCMQKNHPDKPNMVADILLLLPLLRESSLMMRKSLGTLRNRVKAEATPLLSELTQKLH